MWGWCLAWLIGGGRQQVHVVEGVDDPLGLDVLAVHLGFALLGSVHYMMGHLMRLKQLLIVFSGKDTAEG